MDIVEEIRKDPENGTRRLESEYKVGLMALARRFCTDEGDAEELVNSTLAEVVASIDRYAEQSAFFAWMARILVRRHGHDTERKSNETVMLSPETVEAAADPAAETRIFSDVDSSILRDAIEGLPEDIRNTVVMHYFMGIPVREAAKVLSVPTGTVAWRLHYARMLLAAKLGAAAKKPGGKALLIALALAALTAIGAAVVTAVDDARNTPPALTEGTPISEGGYGAQDSSPLHEGAVAEGDWGSTATGTQRQSAAATSTPPLTHSSTHTLSQSAQGEDMNLRNTSAAMLAAVTVATGAATAAQIAHDGNAQVVMQEGRTVLIYNTNGTFTVTAPGTVELLAVGGGGGGGGNNNSSDASYGGSGGGGGGVWTNSAFSVAAGTYNVFIGAGGTAGADGVAQGGNGGNTTLSFGGSTLVVAYGGGGGGQSYGFAGKNGASGGGSSRKWTNTDYMNPGHAIYCDAPYFNLGHDGGQGTHPYGSGGGGGAGEAGADGNGTNPGKGGDGVEVPILGSGIWYGGGGAGFRKGKSVSGGKSGGGSCDNQTGRPGTDGLGGGGCGGQKGGSGTLIVAFTPSGEIDSGFFEGDGGDEVFKINTATGKDEVRVFQQSGTLTLTGRGTVEVLAVGGGGGGGTKNIGINDGAGGGGAGGFVHYASMPVIAGTYEIEVGAGGAVGANGGVTRGLGVVAYGGGAGGNVGGNNGKDGASGGGASHSFNNIGTSTNAGGRATMSVYANSGHDGYRSVHPYLSGGGGGAGGMGAAPSDPHPGSGGDGLPCSITGSAVWYAGGGAGYRGGVEIASPGGQGGGGSLGDNGVTHPGESNTGGGGCGGSAGGSGVFIVRYHLKPLATVLILK